MKSEEFSEASEGHLKYLVLVGRTQSTMRPTLNTAHFSKLYDDGIQQGRLGTETSRSSTALKILSLCIFQESGEDSDKCIHFSRNSFQTWYFIILCSSICAVEMCR